LAIDDGARDVGLSGDPKARERQLLSLRRPGSTIHGAYSATAIQPIRERLVAELTKTFPSATAEEIATQAMRMAQLEALGLYLDQRGVIAHKRRGTIYPAAVFAAQLAAQFERQHALLIERERDRGGRSPRDPLAGLAVEGRRLRMIAEGTAE
jgi:hypothetical protein